MRNFYERVKVLKTFTRSELQFWAKVDVRLPEECWLWLGGTGSNGTYLSGRFGITTMTGERRTYVSSRFAFESFHGHPPEDQVLHSCDNGLCCNPSHLRDGTQSENIKEAYAKGRKKSNLALHPWPVGNTKITEDDVKEIRLRHGKGELQSCLARAFNLHRSQISRIVNYRNWGSVA